MCCEEFYCFGPSWAGAVNTIAAMDLLTAAIHVTLETASVGVMLGVLMPFNSTKEMRRNCTELDISPDNNYNSTTYPAYCPWLFDYMGLQKDYFVHFDFDTVIVTLLIVIILLGLVIEGYLFSLLHRGTVDRNYPECRKWFFYRFGIFLFVCSSSLTKYLLGYYFPLLDGLLDLFKIYRVVTFAIVFLYMNELAHTVGIIYVKPPKKAKRGSLGNVAWGTK